MTTSAPGGRAAPDPGPPSDSGAALASAGRGTLEDVTDLQRIRARAAAASDGPWQRHGSDVWAAGVSTPLFTGRDGSAQIRRQADADAEFVAHARQDIAALLALLDQQQSGPHSGPAPTADPDVG